MFDALKVSARWGRLPDSPIASRADPSRIQHLPCAAPDNGELS